jgi:hypothetical protein
LARTDIVVQGLNVFDNACFVFHVFVPVVY